MKKTWVLFGWPVIFFLFMGTLLHGEQNCGAARITSGNSCKTLKVLFDLKNCGQSEKILAEVECNKERGWALLKTSQNTFFVPLREISPGVWTTLGNVRQYPKNWQPVDGNSSPVVFRQNREQITADKSSSEFGIGGNFRFRWEDNQKNDFSFDRSFYSFRLRTTLNFRPHEEFRFLVEPQANPIFGEPRLMATTGSANVFTGMSGGNLDPQITFHRALGEWYFLPNWRVILGRQVLSWGEEVLLGPADWENPGRSFDAIRVRGEGNRMVFDLFSSKLWDSNTQTSGNGDRDFHGMNVSWRTPDMETAIEPYFLWLRDSRGQLNQIYTLGLFLQARVLQSLSLKSEVSGQWGNSSGYQAWAEVKSPWMGSDRFFLSLDGFFSTPDFNPLFPSSHKWLGWADVLGRRNLSGFGAQATFSVLNHSELQLRGLHFLKTHQEKTSFESDGITPVETHSSGQSLGSELDVSIRSFLIPSLEWQAAASIFFPSESLRASLDRNWVGRFEISLLSSF